MTGSSAAAENSDIGPLGALPAEQVVKAASMIREGRLISLAASRLSF